MSDFGCTDNGAQHHGAPISSDGKPTIAKITTKNQREGRCVRCATGGGGREEGALGGAGPRMGVGNCCFSGYLRFSPAACTPAHHLHFLE